MEIRIYNPPVAASPCFTVRGRATAAVRASLTERLYEAGHFSVDIPYAARHASQLVQGCLIWIDSGMWGIVDDMTISHSAEGVMLSVFGRELKGLMSDRITIPPAFNSVTGAQGYDTVTGSTETCMKHFVKNNFLNAAQPSRVIYAMEIAANRNRGYQQDKYMSRHETVSNVLASLGKASGLGYDLTPDLARGKFVFDVVQGMDHTAAQSERMRVIFDISRKTALSQTYTCNTSDSRNLFYATKSGSEFADETLTVTYTREGEAEPIGLERRETHLDLSADTPIAGDEYNEMKRLAMLEAESFRKAESFSCEITSGGRYVYRRDYNVGDLVSVVNQGWGIVMHTRLTEMQTEYSAAGVRHTATFGTAPLNVFGRLRRQINKGE